MRPLQKSVRVVGLSSLCLLFAAGQLFAAAGSGSASAGVDQRGEVLALSCAGCHGTDGKSASIMPSIYGKDAGYIQSALIDFKAGTRMSTVMSRHAKGYTDEEIHLIADYFGNLSKKNK